jgi:Zn-dependent protease/predicted transcriptional regulator
MNGIRGWRIASIFGVDVRIHFSLFFILAYVWLVAALQFPLVARQADVSPSSIAGGPFIWGAIFAFFLFLSVLLHEFGHVAMARSFGARVNGITLMMLGGISEIQELPGPWHREFLVAIAGPLVSVLLSAGLFGMRAISDVPEVSFFGYWLGSVNIVLAIFNLLPAFPLDGGRALRSLLSSRMGPLKATRIAVRFGTSFAVLFGLIGLWQFNIILMLIALFLYSAAKSELILLEGKEALRDVRAGHLGQRIPAIPGDWSLARVVERMRESGQTVVPVQSRNGQSGTVAVDDISALSPESWAHRTADSVMHRTGIPLRTDDLLEEHYLRLRASPNRALPLSQNGEIIGIVRAWDIINYLRLQTLESPGDQRLAS